MTTTTVGLKKTGATSIERETSTRVKDVPRATNNKQGLGICAVCVKMPDCIYLDSAKHAILMCEMFEAHPVLANSPVSTSTARSMHTQVADKRMQNMGLCGSCAKRETCIYPKPETGVWRCEEYV